MGKLTEGALSLLGLGHEAGGPLRLEVVAGDILLLALRKLLHKPIKGKVNHFSGAEH